MLLSVPESNVAPRQRRQWDDIHSSPASAAAAVGAPQTPNSRSSRPSFSSAANNMMLDQLSPQLHNVRLTSSRTSNRCHPRHHSITGGPSSSDIAGAIEAPTLFTPTINSPRRSSPRSKRRSIPSFPASVVDCSSSISAISTCSLSSMSSVTSTASSTSSCRSNTSLASKLAKLQQQSLILHQQQQQQLQQQLQHLQQQKPKRRVTFAEDVYLYPSPHDSNDHVKPLWYSVDELADFKKDRRNIVKQLKKAQFDISRVPRKYCLRGYEAYFSLNINKAMKCARELSLTVVAVEQARQRARGVYNPEALRHECCQASQWARDNGIALGAQDAQLDFVEQDAHHASSSCHSSKSSTTYKDQPLIMLDYYSSHAANPAASAADSSSRSKEQHRKKPKKQQAMTMLTLVDDETLRQMEKTLAAVREMLP